MIKKSLRIQQATMPYLFQNGSILTDLPDKDLGILKSSANHEIGKRGDLLFRQGAFPKGVHWLVHGKAKIFQETPAGERQTFYIYSDGDLIGYRQFIAEEAHPVSAILLEDSTYMLIPGSTFRDLLHASPFFSRNVMTALAREFTVWMNRMTVFTKYPVLHRLTLSLLILHEQYRLSGGREGEVTITRTELAEYVGASLETVVRALQKLKAANLVEVHGRHIMLLDTDGMLELLEKE